MVNRMKQIGQQSIPKVAVGTSTVAIQLMQCDPTVTEGLPLLQGYLNRMLLLLPYNDTNRIDEFSAWFLSQG